MASSSTNGSIYDVFLSFRGEDTRNAFTDHLYEALVRAGLRIFRDDDELDRGQELKPNIKKAIKESRASIVVLSENYATSTWCLDELLLILEQRREYNQFVLPVFYHVDPSDVRKQSKTFKINVKTYSRWTEDNVNKWKVALTNIADLTGLVLTGPETTFLKKIVDTIYKELDCKEVHIPSNLIGMVARREEINSWLDKHRLEFLAICGMGGSGKTTLAKYIYDSNCKKFENTSFLEDIGTKCERPNGLLELQEQLLEDILGGKKTKLHGVSQGTRKIAKALETKRILIVLDDMVEHSQLVALLGNDKINARSKIIITTRENTENWFKFTTWRCQNYRMVLLNDGESLELLSLHSFGSKSPMEAFNELAMQAVRYCEGNPLALKVLASSLSIKNTVLHWRSQLNLLERDGDDGIQGVLIRSYMSLPSDSEKELFLHIACFFIGEDMDYVEKILEPDYSAICGIKTLMNRYLLSVSSNKQLMMHRLLQEMGKNIVRQESSKRPEKRSRIWLNSDSYKILRKGKGSKTIEGLALDMQTLRKEDIFKSFDLKTDALQNMDKLKLLQLKFVELTGSYEKFSEDLRWLCWFGFHSRTIPSGLFMGNLVALDMSYSKLEVFEPPMVLVSLKILNLKDSYNLSQIRNISRIPNLETFMLCHCQSLVHVCETIGNLTRLALLNMTGCENLCKRDKKNVPSMLTPSTSNSGEVTKWCPFSFPRSLQRLFLKDCNLDCNNSLSFSVQPVLQYLNLGNSLFESLPCYDHLKDLRVLDLSLCSKLKELLYLPCTLAELYIYYCKSLEKITFQSHQFTLQEFGYEGCSNLSEVEDFMKLVPIAKLHETDLGHMVWLKDYKDHEMCLVGDDELTIGRSRHAQMLYEFNIMSTSLPDIKNPNMMPEHISESQFLSFQVPTCPKGRSLKGLNITFKYTLFGKDWAWFAKISTTNGVELMYNPKVFGKNEFGEVAIWLSYWPIGNKLDVGDGVNVSIVVINGLEICNFGVSLVYADDEAANKTLPNKMGWGEILGGDFSGFRLSTGAYYLCRRDFFELLDSDRPPPGWFWDLVGDIIDYTEIQGWRKTGRRKDLNPLSTELRTVRCTIHDPELKQEKKMPEMSESSFVDKPVEYRSTTLGEKRKYDTAYPTIPKVSSSIKREIYNPETMGMSKASGSYIPETMGKSKAFAADKQANANRGWKKEKSESYNLENMDMRKASGSFQQGDVELPELDMWAMDMYAEDYYNLAYVGMGNDFDPGLVMKRTAKQRWKKLRSVIRFIMLLQARDTYKSDFSMNYF
ncbi:disease resistance protein RML1A-like [Cynara cardunculus var. scolymus]|uniref:disease resistance protein RML1A-like n=1 Tax=Cynara cardunculus var. scolymus TaxID=59895 RepID=UPI000D629BE2|nr:disease resistance protein RML1A-like [Cynara cardunculus var. scolymus]